MRIVPIVREEWEWETEVLFDNLERLGAANPDAAAAAFEAPAVPECRTRIEVDVMFVLDEESWCPRLA